jgi:two-component system cell cycle response regulator
VRTRRFFGAFLGVIGLGLGIAGLVVDSSVLAVVAGLAALAAGAAAWVGETDLARVEAAQEELTSRLGDAEGRAALLRTELEAAQHQIDADQGRLAELADAATGGLAGEGSADPSDTRVLADPETNLFSEAYFRVALDARIASARRHLRPVAVALLDVVEGGIDASGAGSGRADPLKVTGSIRQTLRDADTACRMADGRFAIIHEDTPENGAVWTVERIRRNLTSRHGAHTMWAGVACYPAHAFSTDELLDQAGLALEAAREWKQDRIEIATAE